MAHKSRREKLLGSNPPSGKYFKAKTLAILSPMESITQFFTETKLRALIYKNIECKKTIKL